MLQLITSISVLVLVCSAIYLVYTACMYICFNDMSNTLHHEQHTYTPYSIVHRRQNTVNVHTTAIVKAYRPWMNMLLAEYDIVRTTDDEWTTHLVGNCPVHVYSK